ncbi:MAG TPA: response regulator [Vicinamibacterales bacterium]|nr:response regulator [Vicinamibacterales bacterium]
MRALVIDDSAVTRKIIKQILHPLGFEVFEAGDGQEGLNQVRDLDQLDLVLVDWNMPVMDGIQFLRAVRAQGALSSLPIMMVSTNNDAENVATSLEAGATEYIMKPFTPDMMRAKLELLGFGQP